MNIALWQIVLILIIAFIYGIDKYGIQAFTMQAVLAAAAVGAILGDPLTGLKIGAAVQLMSLGVAALGGSSVPDYPLAGIVATIVSISTGQDSGVGLAVGVAVGMLGVQLDVMVKILNGFIARKSHNYMEAGSYEMMTTILWLGPILFGLTCALPTLIMLLFGADAVNLVLGVMPGWFTTGLSIAGGALPVVGMAMLLTFMPTAKYLSFVIVGYVLAAYLHLSILPIALLGGAMAYESYKHLIAGLGSAAVELGALEDE